MRGVPDQSLQVRETHCGGVVLVGERAFKFKKPVDLGFLDFRTPQARWAACRDEVELNSRFAPDVYLGVATLALPDGAEEPLVVMRRMPDDRRLATLVRRGADVDEALRGLARQLAVAHARSRRSADIDERAGVDALRGRWTANLDEARRSVPAVLGAPVFADVERLVHRFLSGRRALFELRVAEGCAVDGHGDLMAEDIFCLDDGPRALDCLEFDEALRFVDRLDDAAFLCMDLERLGAPRLGSAFLAWYAEFSGDAAPSSLRHHYVAYRAFMRAKIACLRTDLGSRAVVEARQLLGISHRHLQEGRVTLTVVGGLPGTGKTTLARALGDRLGAVVLSSDRIRKELASIDPQRSAAAPWGEGIYSSGHTRRAYAELLRQARQLLGLGESVVLDASWSSAEQRAAARGLARETASDLTEVRCLAADDLVAERLSLRRAHRRLAGDFSDADTAVATTMASVFAPWPEAVAVDTAPPPEDTARQVAALVRPVTTGYAAPRPRSMIAPD
ncbi:MAG TPA: AAA family ATPase [Marmoricola sp.]|nr:AAA family ATPase [Marmoricola sp.]